MEPAVCLLVDGVITRLLRSRAILISGVLTGVGLRIALVVLFVPLIQLEWFEPFFAATVEHPSLDPWSGYLGSVATRRRSRTDRSCSS